MENKDYATGSSSQDSPEVLPSLIQYIGSIETAGFDENRASSNQFDTTCFQNPSVNQCDIHSQRMRSFSINMASSLPENHIHTNFVNSSVASESVKTSPPKRTRFHSQPLPTGSKDASEAVNNGDFPTNPEEPPRNPRLDKLKDKRFNSFKTWSGKLERQISNLRVKASRDTESDDNNLHSSDVQADRYFAALEGPELESLRDSEELVLPVDERWPFLLRYPITSFGICLGVCGQTIMWKTVSISDSTKFLHISLTANLILWCISLSLVAVVTFTYALKVIFYFEAVRREYYHPIRINFFFAPFLAFLFLVLGAPPSVAKNLHASIWYILMTPMLFLEIKIYGQWMLGGQRRLSKVANPSNHLSIVGNFVGSLLGASMGLKEGPLFFFGVGLAHYTVVFVTLYQRLPTNDTLPKELHPVFFLFIAGPSMAAMAWAEITESFGYGSRIAYFIAMFLYCSLVVRVNFFRGFRFSLAWWAYTFPMTGAAIATIKYSNEVTNVFTQALSVTLCVIATLISAYLLVTTILHTFVLQDMFPNDVGIAISGTKLKSRSKWYRLRNRSSDNKDIDCSPELSSSESKDIEASL